MKAHLIVLKSLGLSKEKAMCLRKRSFMSPNLDLKLANLIFNFVILGNPRCNKWINMLITSVHSMLKMLSWDVWKLVFLNCLLSIDICVLCLVKCNKESIKVTHMQSKALLIVLFQIIYFIIKLLCSQNDRNENKMLLFPIIVPGLIYATCHTLRGTHKTQRRG